MEARGGPVAAVEAEQGVLNAPKLLRLASMLNAGIEEARAVGDQAAAARASAILARAVVQAGSALGDDLLTELDCLLVRTDADVTEREQTVVTTQLVGWLLGVLADPTSWVYVDGHAAA